MARRALFTHGIYRLPRVFVGAALLLCLTCGGWCDDLNAWGSLAVSPDGKRIAFRAPDYDDYGDAAKAIWVAGIDGGNPKKLGAVPEGWEFQWCGNDTIAAHEWIGNKIRLFLIGGGDPRTVSVPEEYFVLYPVFSPDGKRMAFDGYEKKTEKSGAYVMEVASGKISLLIPDATKSHIAWSPDSRRIAVGIGAYQKDYNIKIANVETGEVTDTGINGVGVAFSPDGNSIAYTGNAIKGGSWFAGIPIDGRLMLTNLTTKETIPLSEGAINISDETTKRWEIGGAIWPRWSRDGKQIAYLRQHSVHADKEDPIDESEVWVVDADGTHRQKMFDKITAYAWSSDPVGLLVMSGDKIARIAPTSGERVTVATVTPGSPPATAAAATGEMKAPGAIVSYSGIDPAYATAILKLASEARSVYANKFGFAMPEEITVEVIKDSKARTNLWTDGDSQVFLTVKSNADLARPEKSGYFSVYGICHELGHISLYRNIVNLGLPPGVAEGWPHYTGSIVVDEVWRKIGENLWPQPYDYLTVDGTARLEKQLNDASGADDPMRKAALAFYTLGKTYRHDKVMAAMKAAVAGRPYGKDVIKRFADELNKLTGNPSAASEIPPDILTSAVEWKSLEREITDQVVEGLVQENDETGITLRYDDGTSDGKRSTAGSGHAVVFRAPAGSWAVDGIQMYGGRYGTPEPPKENFMVFVCDSSFEPIQMIERPYSDLGGYDEGWRKISFSPVKVPEGFCICVYFNPTATKGFYMNYDTSIAKSHSKAALPWTFVYDLEEKRDWMIRPHLIAAE